MFVCVYSYVCVLDSTNLFDWTISFLSTLEYMVLIISFKNQCTKAGVLKVTQNKDASRALEIEKK